ncbi:MAG: alpha/beta hydrolase [Planctomycetia bacterium]|nr:alpha/beta hydrolase [Planctomycetia bacterium]
MKKTRFRANIFVLALLISSVVYAAETQKNVSYNLAEVPPCGDAQYAAERRFLDVHVPDALPADAPILVWFHGGGLSGGGKHIPQPFLNQKFVTIAADYRLFPRAKVGDALEDAAAVVVWAMKNAQNYGADPKKIYVSGHSAGGYLAAMIAMAPQYMEKFGASNMDIAGAFPVSGQMTTHFRIVSERAGSHSSAPNNPLLIDEFAPLFYTTRPVPPMHLLVGDPKLEWPARVEENALLAAMLKTVKHANLVVFQSYPNTNHGTVATPAQAYIVEIMNKVAE